MAPDDLKLEREEMVRTHIAARGILDAAVLEAASNVPREAFLPPELVEFAYRDSPLPIACNQTISQPYIVALMAEALQLGPADRVLEIGTGSGYAAAILSQIGLEVFTIERHEELATTAAQRLSGLGYANVHVRHGDGTLGWPEEAPFDAIVVAAGGPEVPDVLRSQLAIGGRLVIPIGGERTVQTLVRISRLGEDEYRRENLGSVRFVPLIGAEGWDADGKAETVPRERLRDSTVPVAHMLRDVVEPLHDFESRDFGALVERIGDARIVLLGEASHGTSEFYRIRDRITRELIEKRGFRIVAVEADWPDASRVHQYVRGIRGSEDPGWFPFERFPTWMWRNSDVLDFVEWLRTHNGERANRMDPVGFYGLDLYSVFTSIQVVLRYLDAVDPNAARVARVRYGCLSPWENDPQTYGRAALAGTYRTCEKPVVKMLQEMLERQIEYAQQDGEFFLDAVQNASLIANAERYYRAMYYGSNESWNLRDGHMFATLQTLLDFHGPTSKAVVWEHNSHLGDARATEMSARGQLNVGQLCKENFGEAVYSVGFGTDHGTVAAASHWDGPMQVMRVRPALESSYERLCHDSKVPAFCLPLRDAAVEVFDELAEPRLERAIGVIYRPETELHSHYFQASLPHQFDEYIWIDETRAVRPIPDAQGLRFSGEHPFAMSRS